MLALVWLEVLERIPQHRSRHLVRVSLKECAKGVAIALANFTEHPATCLVHEVVLVIKQLAAQAQARFKVVVAYKRQRGHDSDASVPYPLGARQSVQQVQLRSFQGSTHNLGRTQVNQVPTIDPPGVT